MTLTIDLTGRTALVTGGARGIGAAISRTLASAGAQVAINFRAGQREADALAAELGAAFEGQPAFSVEADIADEAAVLLMFQTVRERMGRLDILVNNAGTESIMPATELTTTDWDRIMDVNLRGAFLCSREAARMMRRQGRGVIVNNSSIHDSVPRRGLAHYSASKAGLTMLTRSLGLELARDHIRVVGVAPGAIETDLNRHEIDAVGRERFAEWIPAGRLGTTQDVAAVVAFLASDLCGYVTGVTVSVDGGYCLNAIRYDPTERQAE